MKHTEQASSDGPGNDGEVEQACGHCKKDMHVPLDTRGVLKWFNSHESALLGR